MFIYEANLTIVNDGNMTYEVLEVYRDGRPKLRVGVFDDRMVGIVSFEPAPNQFGTASFEVFLVDSGPVSEVTGSKNTSEPGYFNLTIRHVNEAPSFGLLSNEIVVLSGYDINSAEPTVVMSKLPYKRVQPQRQDSYIHFRVVPAINYTVCKQKTVSPEALAECMAEIDKDIPFCVARKTCPVQESEQSLSYFIISARQLSGNVEVNDADLLRDGGGVFAPPSFTGTCDPRPVRTTLEAEIKLTEQLLQRASRINERLELVAKLNLLRAVRVSQHRTATFIPDINVGKSFGPELEEQRLTEEFCSTCEPRVSVCLGRCVGCENKTCNNNSRSAMFNCNGTCLEPANCGGKLTVHTPTFDPAPGLDDAGNWYLGWMQFDVLPGKFGRFALKMAIVDSGGTENGGKDTSIVDFVLNIFGVNSPPELMVAKRLVIPEVRRAFLHSFPQLLNTSEGANERQNVTFSVVAVRDLRSVFMTSEDGVPMVSVGRQKTLDFTLRPYANGLAQIDIASRDDGGTEFGGLNEAQNFTIDILVLPVNDPPFAEIRPEIYAVEDEGIVRAPLFASKMSKGPPDELWQLMSFRVMISSRGSGAYGAQEDAVLFSPASCPVLSYMDKQQCSGWESCLDMRWLRASVDNPVPAPADMHVTGADVAQVRHLILGALSLRIVPCVRTEVHI
jgi:hypothetical protein